MWTHQSVNNDQTDRNGSIKPNRTTLSLTLSPSRDAHGDRVADTVAAVSWPIPTSSVLVVATNLLCSLDLTFSLRESSWGALLRLHPSLFDLLGLGF
jgi:hypothetical protein